MSGENYINISIEALQSINELLITKGYRKQDYVRIDENGCGSLCITIYKDEGQRDYNNETINRTIGKSDYNDETEKLYV